jgi:phosphocarrier protein FPr
MDLGSAVLSAEMALEMLDDDARDRVVLCPAPLVEGLVAACVAAGGGASRAAVAEEALGGLAGKQQHLGGTADTGSVESPAAEATASVVVSGPHGLHARPAARLVQSALAADATVEVRNATTGSAWVPASSLARVATLGALDGHELELRASGPAAGEALAALVDLVARGDDEPAGAAPRAAVPASPSPGPGATVAVSRGIAIGPARVRRAEQVDVPAYEPSDPAGEWSRLTAARDSCRAHVQASRRAAAEAVGEQGAAVFDAHLLLLDDEELLAAVRRLIDGGEAAPTAWTAAVRDLREVFAALDDPYLRERASDVEAVGDDVLRALVGGASGAALRDVDGVLLTGDLTPAQAVTLDRARVVGVVLAQGSPTSHSAILLRALGIPAVAGAGAAVLDTPDGTLVALDGASGELVLEPDEGVLARLRDRDAQLRAAAEVAGRRSTEPALTSDGVEVHVAANLGSVEDALLAAAQGADLAGLVRTEFLFLGRSRAPDVEEQEAEYRRIAEALGARRITLRTLDVGGDKSLPYVPLAPEANPFLGVRGLRLSLAVPGLLADQLLAMVRVARDTPVSIMFPMVTTVAELLVARAELEAAITRDGQGRPAGLRVGMMVEVPAAALKAAAFAQHVDFFSVGTNDLTQYTLATERGNPGVAGLSDAYDPGVLRLVAAVCAGAGEVPVAVCGELAADEAATELLIGLGVRELSVSPRAVAGVKQAVRAVETTSAAATAARALDAESAQAVRALLH